MFSPRCSLVKRRKDKVQSLFRTRSSTSSSGFWPTPVLTEPPGDGAHEGAELLDAEEPGAERVEQERAASPHDRRDQPVNGPLVQERPRDRHRDKREKKAGYRRDEHPDRRPGDPPAVQAADPAQQQRPGDDRAGQ